MCNRWRLRCVWGLLICGLLLMSIVPNDSSLGQVNIRILSNKWVCFLAYMAVVAIPWVAWHTRRDILYCFSTAAFCGLCGFLHAIASNSMQEWRAVTPEIFGFASGILLGLNLRQLRNSGDATAGASGEQSGSIAH